MCQQGAGAARLAKGSTSLEYMTLAANVASCLAQAKVLPKP